MSTKRTKKTAQLITFKGATYQLVKVAEEKGSSIPNGSELAKIIWGLLKTEHVPGVTRFSLFRGLLCSVPGTEATELAVAVIKKTLSYMYGKEDANPWDAHDMDTRVDADTIEEAATILVDKMYAFTEGVGSIKF